MSFVGKVAQLSCNSIRQLNVIGQVSDEYFTHILCFNGKGGKTLSHYSVQLWVELLFKSFYKRVYVFIIGLIVIDF